MEEKTNTIMFYIVDQEDGINAVKYLTEDIKSREEANHKLYFRFLLGGAYVVSRGHVNDQGIKEMIGNNEIIFIPSIRQRDIERLKELKNVIWYKNIMTIAGKSKKSKELRQLLIDWLLEKREFDQDK